MKLCFPWGNTHLLFEVFQGFASCAAYQTHFKHGARQMVSSQCVFFFFSFPYLRLWGFLVGCFIFIFIFQKKTNLGVFQIKRRVVVSCNVALSSWGSLQLEPTLALKPGWEMSPSHPRHCMVFHVMLPLAVRKTGSQHLPLQRRRWKTREKRWPLSLELQGLKREPENSPNCWLLFLLLASRSQPLSSLTLFASFCPPLTAPARSLGKQYLRVPEKLALHVNYISGSLPRALRLSSHIQNKTKQNKVLCGNQGSP